MAFTKVGKMTNPKGGDVLENTSVNRVNPGYPGFPAVAPSTRTTGAIDHSGEAESAKSKHLAAKSGRTVENSANHHLNKERRSRPNSMDTGTQILDGKKGSQAQGAAPAQKNNPQAKLALKGTPPVRGQAGQASPKLGFPNSQR